ncbi:MAG TPA: sigma factor [Candidatus Cybelea sp.]
MALRCGATRRRLIPRERLVVKYWYLCRRAARRFRRCGFERDDLEQVGAIGLIKAVDRYKSPHRAPFEAFASLLVLGELMHYVRDDGLVRVRRGRARPTILSLDFIHGDECCTRAGGIDDLLDRLTVESMLQRLPPLERRIVSAFISSPGRLWSWQPGWATRAATSRGCTVRHCSGCVRCMK